MASNPYPFTSTLAEQVNRLGAAPPRFPPMNRTNNVGPKDIIVLSDGTVFVFPCIDRLCSFGFLNFTDADENRAPISEGQIKDTQGREINVVFEESDEEVGGGGNWSEESILVI